MTFEYARGEVYLVQESNPIGSEIKKTRPWVLVGNNPINKARSTVLALPLSTQAKPVPNLSIPVKHQGKNGCAVIDQLRALDKRRFIRLEGRLKAAEIAAIEQGMRCVLCLP